MLEWESVEYVESVELRSWGEYDYEYDYDNERD
jgi:hypothetical protein